MRNFNVLTLSRFLTDDDLDLAIGAFSELYYKVTYKHHKRINLQVICGLERAEVVLAFARKYKVSESVEMIPEGDFEQEEWKSLDPSVLFVPTQRRVGKLTRKALSQGIPIVSFQNESIAEYVDNSCGMLLRKQGFNQNKEGFSRILDMLYFDPEVRKLMKKGAENKYKEISGQKTYSRYRV